MPERKAHHAGRLPGHVHVTVWFDGACTGNPGAMGAGAVLEAEGRREVVRVPLGRGTNNEAEYGGLIAGLRAAKRMGATQVTVHGDSQLVIRHLEGSYKVKAANLRPLYEEARDLLATFDEVDLNWVRREENAAADRAAREAVAMGPR